MALELSSPAFHHGESMPDRHARKGDNLSPKLSWRGAPAATKSFVLVVEDPDAPSGVFRHWAVHAIPADAEGLDEGAGRNGPGAPLRQAANDFGATRYDGPEPPPGHGVHHYHFRLAALDAAELGLPDGARAEDVWDAARPHIIEETDLVGTYERP